MRRPRLLPRPSLAPTALASAALAVALAATASSGGVPAGAAVAGLDSGVTMPDSVAAEDHATALAQPADAPALSLRVASRQLTLPSHRNRVTLDVEGYLVAGDEPFLLHTRRERWAAPITASVHRDAGAVALPAGLVSSFGGGRGIVKVHVFDRSGERVATRQYDLCGYGRYVRLSPDAPSTSPYPRSCGVSNPFTIGSVHGLQAGWGLELTGRPPVELAAGRYTAVLRIGPRWVAALDLPASATTSQLSLRVVKGDCRGCRDAAPGPDGRTAGPAAPHAAHDGARVLQPAAEPSDPVAQAPADAVLPDLRSLPAWDMQVRQGTWLAFSATVWNAGPSPMVVDGFRREGEDLMDAYQYFFDGDGDEVGSSEVGQMEWDPKPNHHHWHFTDFARYSLLDADKLEAVRSRKEAFCLANTDMIDYTVPGANWDPYNTELHSACGSYTSLGLREVLDAGSGDTYAQFRPGQSFHIRNLQPGIYYVAVDANPEENLVERDYDNNVAYRKIRIMGQPGTDRTVRWWDVGQVVNP